VRVFSDEITVKEIFETFFEPGESGHVAVLKRAYFDDSYDGRHELFAIAGGVIANHSRWTGFQRAWKKALHAAPRIEYFHAKEWRRLNGQFFQFREDGKWSDEGKSRADEKRDKLIQVIRDYKVVGLGVGVLIKDYNAIREAHPRAAEYFASDPYEGALQSFVFESAAAVRLVQPGDVIAYVSDDSNRADVYTRLYYEFKKKNPSIAPMLRGISHLDNTKWAGLQAADIVANMLNQEFKRFAELPPEQRQLDELLEGSGFIFKVAHWDKKYMCQVLLDTIGLDLFEKMGVVDRGPRKSDEQVEFERLQRTGKLQRSNVAGSDGIT